MVDAMSARVTARFIEPMLLLQASRLPEGTKWGYELKLGWYRALAVRTKARRKVNRRTMAATRRTASNAGGGARI
jgi:hypothetical protein